MFTNSSRRCPEETRTWKPESCRRQGLATITGAAFVAACLDEAWETRWSCFADNEGSPRLVAKPGFVEPVDFPIWAWSLLEES